MLYYYSIESLENKTKRENKIMTKTNATFYVDVPGLTAVLNVTANGCGAIISKREINKACKKLNMSWCLFPWIKDQNYATWSIDRKDDKRYYATKLMD